MVSFLDAMKKQVIGTLANKYSDLLSQSVGQSVNKETGEVSDFLRVEFEVRKGNGELSRCRGTVKIPNGKMKITDEELNKNEYAVSFEGLEISFIDNKGNVYFRADDYTVKKET